MGHMIVEPGGEKPAGTQPTPKSKRKKSIGPSLRASLGTRKTEAGSKKGRTKTKAGKNVTPKAAGMKKGTVYRSSKESRGERPGGFARTKKAANRRMGSGKPTLKKPVSKSRGKNSSISSSRPFAQP